jgi:uncharacterized integral membrane protein
MNLLCLLIIRPEIVFMQNNVNLRVRYWTGTCVELPYILGYQMAYILTLVFKGNFLLLLVYLGCATNQRSIPMGYLLHLLGQGHSILVCV